MIAADFGDAAGDYIEFPVLVTQGGGETAYYQWDELNRMTRATRSQGTTLKRRTLAIPA